MDLERDLAPSVRMKRLKKWTTHHMIALPWEYDGIRFYLTDKMARFNKRKEKFWNQIWNSKIHHRFKFRLRRIAVSVFHGLNTEHVLVFFVKWDRTLIIIFSMIVHIQGLLGTNLNGEYVIYL